jgi:hypothetical protein
MFYHPRAPTEFFRVEDASSRASYVRRKGIFAEDEYARVDFGRAGARLRARVKQHLRWENRHPTPFISAYSDEDVARDEAKRRCRDGKQDVRIYIIDTDRRGGMEQFGVRIHLPSSYPAVYDRGHHRVLGTMTPTVQ